MAEAASAPELTCLTRTLVSLTFCPIKKLGVMATPSARAAGGGG